MLKKLAIVAGLLSLGAGEASAQWGPRPDHPDYRSGAPYGRPSGHGPVFRPAPAPQWGGWNRGGFPYEARHHDRCQRAAWRLRQYERHVAADGVITPWERRDMFALRSDLDSRCGRYRWRG